MIMLRLATLSLLCCALTVITGCEVDSPTDVQRSVGVDFTGFYSRTGSSNETVAIVSRNTGSPITSFDLRQGGDRLEAIDNNGIIFKGNIGTFDGTTASFELIGRTTAGNKGTVSGTLTASGSGTTNAGGATSGAMQGTWIEDSLYGTVRAEASIPGITRGGGGGSGGSLSIEPSSTSVGLNSSATFTATGGSGSITWSFSSGTGNLSTFSGTQTTFTRTISGQVVLQARDSVGRTADAIIN
jgi:hypothetical protein